MRITVYIDGLTEPINPGGVTTCAFVVYQDGKKIHEEKKFVGKGKGYSNNVAEYSALHAALHWLLEKGIRKNVEIRSDSRLLVNQMKGEWKVKGGLYVETYKRARTLADKFEDITFRWIPREQNQEADKLSRIAYDEYLHGS
ncbi:MAG: ribonuclease HI [Conexivisphaerales archaeon]